MERQDLLGDLMTKTKEQLREILSRQEKLLNNKRFVQTLPDKGKKISEFVEKVHRALANKEKEEKTQSAQSEFQARYQQAFVHRRHVASTDPPAVRTGLEQDTVNTETLCLVDAANREGSENFSDFLCTEDINVTATTSGNTTASGNVDTDTDLMVAFEQVTLSEENTVPSRDTARNPFSGSQQQQKKPHYIEVLEKSAGNVGKPKLKLNQLPVKSASSSPGQSSGSVTLLSAEARRQRDRKHLDDITAAKLPPLHHSPAQLLSLTESVTLLQEQTKKYQELQAKLAAQKLAEGLAVSINSYHPEGGALAAYREVHDDGALSEED